MPKIEIYTTLTCPFCHAAKQLLTDKGAVFSEFSLSQNPNLREQMIARAQGGRTVPQIFIDDTHIGGCDELYALDAKGGLDPLLNG
ncbi:MAG: glutaredoxin 3 [Alphaproteobacteria bacterium]|nr:glutaredoxin 3 [Alphaproteobacteria bacterium]